MKTRISLFLLFLSVLGNGTLSRGDTLRTAQSDAVDICNGANVLQAGDECRRHVSIMSMLSNDKVQITGWCTLINSGCYELNARVTILP